MSDIDFRYLIPEPIFEELTAIAKQDHTQGDKITSGWILADRKENFGIIRSYQVTPDETDNHIRPKSWMRMKKKKLFTLRKLKDEQGIDIAWQFHTHPNGKEELHDVDTQILNYLSTGVMIIVTPSNVLGWYFDKRESKKPYIDKMVFEIIND